MPLEVFPDQPYDHRISAQDLVHDFQFTGVLVREADAAEQIQFGNDSAHPGAPFQVEQICIVAQSNYALPKTASPGCVFFYVLQQLTSLWMGSRPKV